MSNQPKQEKGSPGPAPDRLRLEGDWQSAITEAVRKPKPPEGWPVRPAKPRKKRIRHKRKPL